MAANFEKLIEYVVADDQKKARNLFHQIVVEKSRKIYEALDMDDDTERAFDDVEADHTASGEDEFGGDEADDLERDVFVDGDKDTDIDVENEEELNPEIDDRVADLESEFDALKAEFEELLHSEEDNEEEILDHEEEDDMENLDSAVAGEDEEEAGEEEEEAGEDLEDEDFEEAGEHEEEAGEDEEEAGEEEEEEPVDESIIREYVLKVTQGLADDKEEGFVNKKSTVAGKNEIVKGITAHNLNQGGVSQGRPTPKTDKMIGDEEVVNRPGRKTVNLKPTPKPVTTKEEGGVNKKSVES